MYYTAYYTQRDFTMAISVRLDPESEAILENLCATQGRTKSDVLRDALHLAATEASNQNDMSNPASLVEDLIGCVDDAPSDLARNHKQRFRDILETKRPKA